MKNYHDELVYPPEGGPRVRNPDYIDGCCRSRLIQRLRMPSPNPNRGDGFAFGGGLVNGGLSPKAWDLISPLCSFDYMGASEFERGALPQAINAIAGNAATLQAYPLIVSGPAEFPFGSRKFHEYDYDVREGVRKAHLLRTTVFVLTPLKLRPHVDQLIGQLAFDEDDMRLKESARLRQTIFSDWRWGDRSEDEWQWDVTQGWLELNNGFMFFANEDMWLGFCRLFGVTVQNWPGIEVVRPDFASFEKAISGVAKEV